MSVWDDYDGQVGPCSEWITGRDVPDLVGYSKADTDYDWAAATASELLFELSGRRFPGVCDGYDRPGTEAVGEWWHARPTWTGWGWNAGDWRGEFPMWLCGCESRIVLRGRPVTEVVAVKIDGAAVDADTYRIEDGHYLRRLGDAAWPAYQDLGRADTDNGTFAVTYKYGQMPPRSGLDAAAALAVELQKAKAGKQCTLPMGVTQIVRQGVAINKTAINMLKEQGFGLPLVDIFLSTWGISVPTVAVWSPDLAQESPNFYPGV